MQQRCVLLSFADIKHCAKLLSHNASGVATKTKALIFRFIQIQATQESESFALKPQACCNWRKDVQTYQLTSPCCEGLQAMA